MRGSIPLTHTPRSALRRRVFRVSSECAADEIHYRRPGINISGCAGCLHLVLRQSWFTRPSDAAWHPIWVARGGGGSCEWMFVYMQQQSPMLKKPSRNIDHESCIFNRASARWQTIFQAAHFSWDVRSLHQREDYRPRAMHNLAPEG